MPRPPPHPSGRRRASATSLRPPRAAAPSASRPRRPAAQRAGQRPRERRSEVGGVLWEHSAPPGPGLQPATALYREASGALGPSRAPRCPLLSAALCLHRFVRSCVQPILHTTLHATTHARGHCLPPQHTQAASARRGRRRLVRHGLLVLHPQACFTSSGLVCSTRLWAQHAAERGFHCGSVCFRG